MFLCAGSRCKPCIERQHSSKKLDRCLNKTVEFLPWSDPFSIILCSLAATGIIVTVVFAVLFAINLRTPAVPAGWLLPYVHFHWQTYSELKLRRFAALWYSLTLCIFCILANLFQILLGFNFDLTIGPWIKKLNQPLVLVTVVSGIQVAVSVSWLIFNPPTPQEIQVGKTILHQCEMTSFGYFSAMLVYNGCLGLTCFLFAFKGR